MIDYLQGTLLISNILLILLAIIYGVMIVKKHTHADSTLWVYFMIACGLFFLSELMSFLGEFYRFDIGLLKGILNISFGFVVLLAFITKYSSMPGKQGKK
ncbi:MAG: hypothetical protein KKF44_06515 [Nanoarchaeota archaeon]|nr:hypothetical protein [Nanoarchaeota archaeon]